MDEHGEVAVIGVTGSKPPTLWALRETTETRQMAVTTATVGETS